MNDKSKVSRGGNMKISEMIKNLQELMEECGDLECWYAIDDEGNGYNQVVYEPSTYCIFHDDGEVHHIDDADALEMEPEEYTKICVVN